MHASVLAIADDLTENGFVLRYRTDETDDGLSGKEGTFLICSFWLVSALSIVGEGQRAHDLMERLLRVGSPLGLYAEEFDVRHRPAPGELPAGVLASGADRGLRADHPRRAAGAGGTRAAELSGAVAVDPDDALGVRNGTLRRDHHRHRRRRRDARAPPGSFGQEHPAARARRMAAARAAERLGRGGVRQRPLRDIGHVALRERRGIPAPGPLLRRRRDEDVRGGVVPAARRRLRRASPSRRRSPRHGRSATTKSSRTTRSPSATTTSTGPAARTRPSHRRARRTRSRRCRTSRASRSCQTTSRSSATIPSTRRVA